MTLRITDLHVRVVPHRLRADRVVVSSAGVHDESTFIEVTVTDADGRRGFGEGATTPMWSGEHPRAAKQIIESLLAPAVIGHSFDHPQQVQQALDRVAVGNPFAKAAIDTAAWDLWAKAQAASVMSLIADREPVRRLPTRVSIGAYGVARTVELAKAFWDAGIRVLKFKVGVPLERATDADRLRAVRDVLGDEPVFTVDANGGYASVDAAVRAVESMRETNIVLLEQPTPRDRMAMLAEVRRRVDVPILVDEAVFTPDDLAEAIELDAFDIVGLYPGKNGGFTHALAMAQTAAKAGKACAIGSNLETDLGLAAMGALAGALRAFDTTHFAGDFASSVYYERSSITRPLPLEAGCLVLPEAGAAFGVEPV